MNITFETTEKVNGQMTVEVVKADYQEKMDKELKDYRKRANIPGFRPGQAPMGMIRRQIGAQVKMDAVNKLIGEAIYKYVEDNKIQMLGEPLASEKQEPVDIAKADDFSFIFDIAIAPEINIELGGDDKIVSYEVRVDDELIGKQIDNFASQHGEYKEVEAYDAEQQDMMKGDLRQLDAEGNTLEGGITVSDASMMPRYLSDDDQKKLFEGAKPGTIITFNPKKAYAGNATQMASLLKIEKAEAEALDADFTYQVTAITRYAKAEVGQKLFDAVYGEGAVKSEEEFRQKIADGIKAQMKGDQDYRFILDVREYVENKVGELTMPDALLKRIMKQNNKDKDDKYIEDNYDDTVKELRWSLMRDKLVGQCQIKVEKEEVMQMAKSAARAQFAQYGMNNVPDEYLEDYAKKMMDDQKNVEPLVQRVIDMKLAAALREKVAIDAKEVSMDEFNKLFEKK